MSTPAKRYNAIKAKYPDAVLLFRIGDFYEAFNEDATIITRTLDIPLTVSSDATSKEGARFHFHALDKHLRSLVQAGYQVALCEELEYQSRSKV